MLLIIILYVSSAGKYCGYSSPKPIVSLGNSIFVYFDTNDRYTERGFKALYRAVAPETTSGKDNGHYIMTQLHNSIINTVEEHLRFNNTRLLRLSYHHFVTVSYSARY